MPEVVSNRYNQFRGDNDAVSARKAGYAWRVSHCAQKLSQNIQSINRSAGINSPKMLGLGQLNWTLLAQGASEAEQTTHLAYKCVLSLLTCMCFAPKGIQGLEVIFPQSMLLLWCSRSWPFMVGCMKTWLLNV